MWPMRLPQVLRRSTAKFKIEPTSALSELALSNLVNLVSDLDDLLRVSTIPDTVNMNLNVSTATHVAGFTVPTGKRWRVLAVHRAATTGTSNTEVYNGAGYIYIGADGTAAQIILLSKDFILDQGGTVGSHGTNNAGDGAVPINTWYLEEDAY